MTQCKEIVIDALDGSGKFSAYLAEPDSGQGPGVVLIQEIFGINENMRIMANKLAEEGFRVCAPDLFWRIEPNIQLDSEVEVEREKAMGLNQKVDKIAALKDCIATLNYLREKSSKAGVVGFCLGGRLAYHMATKSDADCSVGYYGVGIETVLDQAVDMDTPLMLHIPEQDHLCPKEAREAIYSALGEKSNVELFTYEGAGHAFARYNSTPYVESAATLANSRTIEFLSRWLEESK